MIESLKLYWREIRVVLIIIAGLLIWWFINGWLDMRKELAAQRAETSTLKSEFQKIGDAYQTKNQVFQDKADANKQATDALGQELVSYMRANQAQLQTLYTAMGTIASTVGTVKNTQGGSRDNNGVVSGVVAQQDRGDKPALTSVSFNYDPSKPVNQAFNGTQWLNNKEVFNFALGSWQLKDGGYRADVRLTRDVYDEKSGTKVGTEEVPMDKAVATFNPDVFKKSISLPRYTLTIGAGKSTLDQKWRPNATLGYRFTDQWGLSGGWVNNGTTLGISYNFDK